MADEPITVQSAQDAEPAVGMGIPLLLFRAQQDVAAEWGDVNRDAWLRKFWKGYGHDILASVLATAYAKVLSQNWVIEGPEKPATRSHSMIRDESDFGKGYDSLIGRGIIDYYTQDNGWFMERLRSGADDHEGPCLGLAHLDSARMLPSGNAEFPYFYHDVDGDFHLMHQSQFIRIVDMPSPETGLRQDERGFCALSRAISTAMVLSLLTAMKREKLGDLPPSALAVFNNISRKQFEAAITLQGQQDEARGQAVWRSLLPLFSIDPARTADVKFISMREVWDNFDEMTATNVAVYAFAAAFRMDPREVWPVSSGALGGGTEAQVQHEKAKAKSAGLLFTQLERAFNHTNTLPPGVTFKFEMADLDEVLERAQTHQIHIANIQGMQAAGAQLTPAEVRYLLAMQYSVLPKAMMDVPKQPVQPATPTQPGQPQLQPGQPAAGGQQGQPGIPPLPGKPGTGVPGQSGSPMPQMPQVPALPVELDIDSIRIDDVERYFAAGAKELVIKLDLGPDVIIDNHGKKEYLPSLRRADTYDAEAVYAALQGAKDITLVGYKEEANTLMERIMAMPEMERKAVLEGARRLRQVTAVDGRLAVLEGIPDDVWDEALADEVLA